MAMADETINFSRGQKLLITLSDGRTLEGIFVRQNKARSGIIFHNLSYVPFDGKVFEQLEFLLDEIVDLSSIEGEKSFETVLNETGSTSLSDPIDTSVPGDITVKEEDESLYEKHKVLVSNHIFIDQIDKKFYEAVSDIQNFKCIAVTGEGSNQGRLGNMTLLCVATVHSVYLFDVINLGEKIFSSASFSLKKFLQSSNILKVVHNCQLLSDCLKHRYKITLRNVFDTHACHCIIVKNESGRLPSSARFPDLIYEYLKLPRSICENKFEDPDSWRRRPLLEGMAEAAAWKVTLIRALKPRMDDALYAPFENLCDTYLRAVRDIDDELQVRSQVHRNEDL